MLALAIRNWKLAAGAVLGAILMFGWTMAITVPNARQEGRELERADANARAMRIIQERSRINEDVGEMSPADLCRELGGELQDDGSCR